MATREELHLRKLAREELEKANKNVKKTSRTSLPKLNTSVNELVNTPYKKKIKDLKGEYNKLLEEIEKEMNRASNNGFIFDTSVIPRTPKRVTTRDISKIQGIKNNLYKHSKYNNNGKLVDGLIAHNSLANSFSASSPTVSVGRLIEDDEEEENKPKKKKARQHTISKARKKFAENRSNRQPEEDIPYISDILLTNLLDVIDSYEIPEMSDYLRSAIMNIVNSIGKDRVANNFLLLNEEAVTSIQVIAHYWGTPKASVGISKLLSVLGRVVDTTIDDSTLDEWSNEYEEYEDLNFD